MATQPNLPEPHLLRDAAPEMYAVLVAWLDGRPTKPPLDAPKESFAYRNWLLFEQGRAALAKARGDTL